MAEAKQRREEKKRGETFKIIFRSITPLNDTLHRKFSDPLRLIRKQQRQVSKVLLDGLYDPDSPIYKLLGVRTEVVGEIIWQKLVENWQIYPEHLHPPVHMPVGLPIDLPARNNNCTVL